MCGRFGLTIDEEALATSYGVEEILLLHVPRYNIAPTQDVPVLRELEGGARRIEGFRWGLVPFWAKDVRIGARMINARSETVQGKPAFRNPWRKRQRCVVLADGFYEWQKPPSGKGPKTPWWIRMADGRPFGFAALWDRWDGGESPLFSCTILTTDANALVRPVHHRMPVVLGDSRAREAWVDSGVAPEEVLELLAPYPGEEMVADPVSRYVNAPGNEGPECVAPVN